MHTSSACSYSGMGQACKGQSALSVHSMQVRGKGRHGTGCCLACRPGECTGIFLQLGSGQESSSVLLQQHSSFCVLGPAQPAAATVPMCSAPALAGLGDTCFFRTNGAKAISFVMQASSTIARKHADTSLLPLSIVTVHVACTAHLACTACKCEAVRQKAGAALAAVVHAVTANAQESFCNSVWRNTAAASAS